MADHQRNYVVFVARYQKNRYVTHVGEEENLRN
jgi:hypothetical protein